MRVLHVGFACEVSSGGVSVWLQFYLFFVRPRVRGSDHGYDPMVLCFAFFFQVLLFPGCPRGVVIMAMARWSLQRLFKMFSILFFFVGLLTRGSVHGYGAMVFAVFLSWASAKNFCRDPDCVLAEVIRKRKPLLGFRFRFP